MIPNDVINTMPVNWVSCMTFFGDNSHYVIATHVRIYSDNLVFGYHDLFSELIIQLKYPVQ